ncbi:MAG: 2Fe-2S ferredoxin [Alphaproteobacteria bacterium]|nr:MAG: 2Fe-2S ferredoxin [Alphaproteobacteria bacterium]
MPTMTFITRNGTPLDVEAPNGLSIMEIAHKHGFSADIEGTCGGSLACATCHVWVHPDWVDKCMPDDGEISEDEEDMLDLAFDLKKSSRLSCQIMMSDDLDGLTVAIPGAKIDWF